MGPQTYSLGAARDEIQRGQRLVVGFVRPEGGHAVGGIGVEGVDFLGQYDVVADPYVVVAQVFGSLGHAAELFRAGHLAAAGQ